MLDVTQEVKKMINNTCRMYIMKLFANCKMFHFRQYMEELVTYMERNPKTKICSKWKSENILQ